MFKVEESVYGPKSLSFRGKDIPLYGYTCGITFDAPSGSRAMKYFQLVSGDLRTLTLYVDVWFMTNPFEMSKVYPWAPCNMQVKIMRLPGAEFIPKDNFNNFMKELGLEYEESVLEELKSYAVYRTPKSILSNDAGKKIQSLIDFFSALSGPL